MMLQAQGWIEAQAVHQIQVVWAFGRLIGNSDMHRGNLSFVPTVPMQVSPVYDMLPMAFAPLQSGEIPGVTFTPEVPTPAQRPAWNQARHAAQAFWQTAAEDMRISQNFRALCTENLKTLNRLI